MAHRPQIVVLISGSGSNLQALLDACLDGQIGADICLVVSNRPDAYGLQRAQRAGVPTQCLDHKQYQSREEYDKALVTLIRKCHPDLVVLAGFMRILTPTFTSTFAGKLINIHPSLLPKYPGLHTHRRALEAGDSTHGATVHFVTSELDGGPAIVHGQLAVAKTDTEEHLAARVLQEIEHKIYPIAVKWICEKRLTLDGNRVLLDGELLPETGFQYLGTETDL